jgi:cellulose synthase/poly-beta-1,6-N-acetylglucosamine synthase-like glycosyltransferase
MRSRSKNKEVVGSDYILTFGKHKGKALWWVLMNDCGYVVWLVDNDVLSVSDGIYEEAKAFYSEMNKGDCGFDACELDLY